MIKWQADKIYPVFSPPVDEGVVITDDEGGIIDLLDPGNYDGRIEEVQRCEGAIIPGFVNAHCHLELSHLHGKVERETTLPGFVRDLQQLRGAGEEKVSEALERADETMYENGIAGVGDISNGESTFSRKAKSAVTYHTFIEIFGFHDKDAGSIFQRAKDLKSAYQKQVDKKVSITAHAPYSVSDRLMRHIAEEESFLSIHNQETASENSMFEKGEGAMFETMRSFGLSGWTPKGKTSLQSMREYFDDHKILFVHNTYTSSREMRSSLEPAVHWCFCPGANLYIENRLPDIPAFAVAGAKCVLGTDSLASNDSLSILEEMKTIKQHFPQLEFDLLLQWATKNGAELFGFDKLGSIEKGKKPGLCCLEGWGGDFQQAELKRLI